MKILLSARKLLHSALALAAGLLIINDATAHPTNEVWVSDQAIGSNAGTLANPYDASTQTKFDALMANLTQTTNMTIHFLPGTFTTAGSGSWTLKTGNRLLGSGIGITTIKLITNAALGATTIKGANGGDYIEILDLTVDANGSQAAGSPSQWTSGIAIKGEHCLIKRVEFKGVAGSWSASRVSWAIHIQPYTSGGVAKPTGKGSLVTECVIKDFVGDWCHGVMMIGQGAIEKTMVVMKPYEQVGGLVSAFNGQTEQGLRISDCVTEGGTYGVFMNTGAATNLVIRGNSFLNTSIGISLEPVDYVQYNNDAETVIIQDNIFELNPSTTLNNVFGIASNPSDGAKNYIIHGNIVKWTSAKTGSNGTNIVYGINLHKINGAVVYENKVDPAFFWYMPTVTNLNTWNNWDLTGNLIPAFSSAYQPVEETAFSSRLRFAARRKIARRRS
ncbi:MAG: hypothetical protein SFY81_01785 [Verrucomicrobiota bacterium]|nr:hypothetical protein [Verrucomicrobiota bacterium]